MNNRILNKHYKGVIINADYTNSDVTCNMFIKASGDYDHEMEIEVEEDYILFTWSCSWKKQNVVLINDGQKIKSNIDSFKEFLSKYFPVLPFEEAENDINITDSEALKEVIVIMEYTFKYLEKEM